MTIIVDNYRQYYKQSQCVCCAITIHDCYALLVLAVSAVATVEATEAAASVEI